MVERMLSVEQKPCLRTVPHVVALTGGIGSGKSTVRKMFEDLEVPCIDADLVAREIHQNPKHPATVEIIEAFPEVASPDGKLSRGSLHTLFAVDCIANVKLKAILKPYVLNHVQHWTSSMTAPYVIWESALIVDGGIDADYVVCVDASNDIRVDRVRARNPSWTHDQILRIFAMQASRKSYLTGADQIICNECSRRDLQLQVAKLHNKFINIWK
ncbi:dephospho-CoA kinase [Undibacterium sp. Dicai25W]|uniref:dephospho-CoA kinase n=1 Tax=Undibacterium sp. Dicai25W TaxID=3413034 RepID=UPI00361F87BC